MKIESRLFISWMGADGIGRTIVKPGSEIELRDAEDNTRLVQSLCDGNFPLLVYTSGIKSISREARKHFEMQNRNSNIVAFGILVDSEVSKIIANFFFKLNSPAVPSRLFTDEKKALDWLGAYVENENSH